MTRATDIDVRDRATVQHAVERVHALERILCAIAIARPGLIIPDHVLALADDPQERQRLQIRRSESAAGVYLAMGPKR